MGAKVTLAVLLLLGGFAWSCKIVDYFYAHAVSGRVVDGKGKPVAGAVVVRVDSKTGEGTAAPALYRRVTGADGTFRFEYRGMGPKPVPTRTWHLVVSHPGFRSLRRTLRIKWRSPSPTGKPAGGYVRRGLELRLQRR